MGISITHIPDVWESAVRIDDSDERFMGATTIGIDRLVCPPNSVGCGSKMG